MVAGVAQGVFHISVSRVTLWWLSFVLRDYPAKFGDNRPFGGGNTNLSIFTWPRGQGVMWHHAWVSIIIRNCPAKLCGHRTCRKGAILLLIGHVTSHDHVINGLCSKSYFIYISRLLSRYLCWLVTCASNQPVKKSTLVADSGPHIKPWTVKRTIGHRDIV